MVIIIVLTAFAVLLAVLCLLCVIAGFMMSWDGGGVEDCLGAIFFWFVAAVVGTASWALFQYLAERA